MENTIGHRESITDTLQSVCSVPHTVTDKEKDISRYVLEKSLRIASATLKLTGLLDTHITLRSSLEKTSLRLVEAAGAAQTSVKARELLLTQVRVLVGLFETAQLAGVIAHRNTSIMTNELAAFVDTMVEVEWTGVRRYMETDMFDVQAGASFHARESYTGPSSTHKGNGFNGAPAMPTSHNVSDKKDMTVNAVKNTHTQAKPHSERVQEIQKDRRATILGLLQKKDRVAVKDVAHVIRDCSEKTIQRELLALVRQGVLVKEGERRWSTYRLA